MQSANAFEIFTKMQCSLSIVYHDKALSKFPVLFGKKIDRPDIYYTTWNMLCFYCRDKDYVGKYRWIANSITLWNMQHETIMHAEIRIKLSK